MEEKITKIAENLIEVYKLTEELKDKEYWIEKASKETDFVPAEGDWIHVEVSLFKIEVSVYHKDYGGARYWRNGHWSNRAFDSNYPMYDEMLETEQQRFDDECYEALSSIGDTEF